MSENESTLQKEIFRYQDSVYDSFVDIEKATMALRELLNEYEWAYEPDARKAIEHSSTIGGSEDKVAQFSYKYIADYRKIMWLVNVALDYCCKVAEQINFIQNGGVVNG